MKKLLLLTLLLACSVVPVLAQLPPSQGAYFDQSHTTTNTFPKVCGYTNGFPIYCDSLLTDNGTSLLYKGAPVSGLVSGATELYDFGDSTHLGAGASESKYILANQLRQDLAASLYDFGISGWQSEDIASVAWSVWRPSNTFTNRVVLYESCYNDANNLGTSLGITNNCINATMSGLRHVSIPLSYQIMASQGIQAGGVWTANSAIGTQGNLPLAFGSANGALNGTGLTISASGASLTFSNLPAASHVGVHWLASDASTGTFTITVNGVLQTSLCSGTTTFSMTGCNGQAITRNGGFSPFAQDFAGNATGSNSITVTTTSAGAVSILGVDTVPLTMTGVNASFVAVQGVIRQQNDGASAATAAANAAVQSVFSTLNTAGLSQVWFVDVRNGSGSARALNTTSDFVACTGCIGGPGGLHPSDVGYNVMKNIYEASATAAGLNIFAPNSGSMQSSFNGPIENNFLQPVANLANDWKVNPGGGQNTTGSYMPGISFYSSTIQNKNLLSGNNARIAFEFDPPHNTFALMMEMGVNGGAFPFCIGAFGLTNALGNTCPYQFWAASAGAHFSVPLYVGDAGYHPNGGPGSTVSYPGFSSSLIGHLATSATPSVDTLFIDTTTPFTLTMPICTGSLNNNVMRILKQSADTNGVTFAVVGGDTINGGTTPIVFNTLAQYTTLYAQCSHAAVGGTNWMLSESAPLTLNKDQNVATLVAGVATVTTKAACTPGVSCNYQFSNCGANASTAIGEPSPTTVTVGTSFVITSLSPTNTALTGDVSSICWKIN